MISFTHQGYYLGITILKRNRYSDISDRNIIIFVFFIVIYTYSEFPHKETRRLLKETSRCRF